MAKIVQPPVVVPAPELPTTPVAVGQAASTVSSLVPTIKDFQKVRLTQKQCIERNLPSTSKGFPRLGIDDDRSVIWAHGNFVDDDRRLIEAFCKSQSIRTCDLMAKICMQWFEDNRDEMAVHADKFIRVASTSEDILKALKANERKTAELYRQLGILQAREVSDDVNDEDDDVPEDDAPTE